MTEKELERMHLLSTVVNYPERISSEICEIANGECQDDLFDPLPQISPRGITSKLNALSLAGLMTGEAWPEGVKWKATQKGEQTWALFLADREVEEAERRRDSVASSTREKP